MKRRKKTKVNLYVPESKPKVFSFSATGGIKTKQKSLKNTLSKMLEKDKQKHEDMKYIRGARREHKRKHGVLR